MRIVKKMLPLCNVSFILVSILFTNEYGVFSVHFFAGNRPIILESEVYCYGKRTEQPIRQGKLCV